MFATQYVGSFGEKTMIQAGVIGVGQTKYDAKRRDVSMAGLVREAIDNAMLAAKVEWSWHMRLLEWRLLLTFPPCRVFV